MNYLIVGLGNVGEEYAGTRHNIGFDVLDLLAGQHNVAFHVDRLASRAIFRSKGRNIVLVKPSTFMNLSGKAVNYWMQQEKISIQHLLVITDDIALPLGTLRLKPKGSDGGHNGLKNIQEVLNTTEYARLRFGVGNEFPKGRQSDFVLGKWSNEEKIVLQPRLTMASDMVLSFTSIGIERTMNSFNNK